jgi:hypothetical protein
LALPLLLAVSFLLWSACPARADAEFLRGDVNSDGQVSIADAGMWGCILFCDFFPLQCDDAADTDDDGRIDIVDLVVLLSALFTAEPQAEGIAPPYPEVGPDPTADSLGCGQYDVDPPLVTDRDVIRLGEVRASRGERVAIPLFVTTAVEVNGVQLAAAYDPEVFTPSPLDVREDEDLFFRGTIFGPSRQRPTAPFFMLGDFPEEGVFRLGFLVDLVSPYVIPPGEEAHVANIPGRVSPDAERGAVMELDLVDHFGADGVLRNELSTTYGGARIVTQLLSGSISVMEGFKRGDANVDGGVDISDAIHILNGLFVGGVVIDCSDSADHNDDARVDISDAIHLLDHLFLGGAPPAPPYPDCGADPSADVLDCVSYPPCP